MSLNIEIPPSSIDIKSELMQRYQAARSSPDGRVQEAAVRFFKGIAEENESRELQGLAFYFLGNCYRDGIGVQPNINTAMQNYEKAANVQLPIALYELGNLYSLFGAMQEMRDLAVACYIQAADKGYAPACFMLGQCFETGWAVPQNEARALEHYTKAAQLGMAAAAYRVASILGHNPAHLQNMDETCHFALNQEGNDSLNRFTREYGCKIVIPQTCNAACRFIGAQELTSRCALLAFQKLGEAYFSKALGERARQEPSEESASRAVYWYQLAESQGGTDLVIFTRLYQFYSAGWGVSQDMHRAELYLHRLIPAAVPAN